MDTQGERGWDELEGGIDIYPLLCIRQIANEILLAAEELYLVFIDDLNGKRNLTKRGNVGVRMANSFCYTSETNTTL